ncbi:MAG: SDR family oxidoreductase [Chloroflexota bacterium]|nr:SDR family oxidoreductase [Chloroflexota bacterium]MBI5702368.1 SDR family oxidoreductase [Chloroflexota bacterium]
MARILITGASGLLGINLALEAMREHEVIGIDRGRLRSAPFRVMQADFSQGTETESILESARPDWLVNCAALANLEECEKHPEQAKRLNTDLPAELAAACAKRNIKFVHLSTDAVFDGTKQGAYTEEDEPNPQIVYSQTKLDGERAVQQVNPQAIIARVNFYGWSLSGQRSLGEFFVNNLSEGKRVYGFTDVVFCPMWVNHLAQTLLAMLEKDLHGLYHVVGAQPMNKYQFGVEVARKFGLRESLIEPQSVERSGLTAKRSHNLWLSVHKLSTDLGRPLPDFSTGLDGFYTQFQQGYPQKIRSYQQA